MKVLRIASVLAVGGVMLSAAPASAQFFLQSRDFTGQPIRSDDAALGLVTSMPGATPAELRAGMVWSMRAALNVAALQCQFEPTILTLPNYNSLLEDHKAELKTTFDTVSKYYARVGKTKAQGQIGLDQFGTRTYARFSAVAAQFGFCQTANSISRDAVFTPRGKFGDLVEARMNELVNSLTPWGEQRFPRYIGRDSVATFLPRFDAICWNKKAEWQPKKCGAQNWPPAPGIGVAAR